MKTAPQDPGKNLSEDLKTFEKLPAKTKDLHDLTDRAEKASGTEREDLNRLIQKKAK